MKTLRRGVAIVGMILGLASNAAALDILVCNDDGFTSANTGALYQQLLQDGHRVIIAAPVDNQSGRGGFISFLAPIPRIPASYIDPYSGARSSRGPCARPIRRSPVRLGLASIRTIRMCRTSMARR